MTDHGIGVSSDLAGEVLRRLRKALPRQIKIMPIGGTVMQRLAPSPGALTKDVDVVLALLSDQVQIPDARDLEALLQGVLEDVSIRKDQACVEGYLMLEAGRVHVEAIRGRRAGGYFVSRRVLREVVRLAEDEDGILRIPAEALAFLKAWAAHDKQKLVETGRDKSSHHARRRQAFFEDVRRIGDAIADRGDAPDATVIARLLAVSSRDRTEAIRRILRDAGWGAVLDDA